jgi:hypothetical protein
VEVKTMDDSNTAFEKKVAFTAGYLSAVGSIVLVQRKYPRLMVNTRHLQVAKRLQRWWGGQIYPHSRKYCSWSISNQEIISRLLSAVMPLLTAERREYFEKRLLRANGSTEAVRQDSPMLT